MKNNLLVLIMILVFLLTTAITLAEIFPEEKIQLNQGENQINIPAEFSPIYAKDFVKAYPEILTITYLQENWQGEFIEIGYVNVFGGIGENFLIQPEKKYTIIVKEDLEVLI